MSINFKRIYLILMSLGLIAGVFMVASVDAHAQSKSRTEGIAAVVNGEAISLSDVNARMRLIMTSSGLPNNEEIRSKMMPQIVNALIDETLKVQEAQKFKIAITDEEIESGIATIASQNNMSSDDFKVMLKRQGINAATLEAQIKSQIAWSKVVQARMRSQVDVSATDVDSVLDRMRSKVGTTEYRVFEIFLPVTDPKEENDVKQLSLRLHGELLQGKVPFQRVASQFSQSPGAAQKGGDLGWVQEGQLPGALDGQIRTLEKGDLGKPVRSLSGYHILYVADKREITEDTLPSTFQVEQDLGNERLNLLQRRHLIDLKTNSFIERRVL